MALLGTIRSKFGWVIMILVVLGVGGFLFMDVGSIGQGNMGSQLRIVGSVDGVEITRDEFDAYIDDYGQSGMSSEEVRSYAWKEILADKIFRIQAQKIGAEISDKELEDLFIGENISPIIAMQFQQSGAEIDRAAIEQQRNSYYTLSQRKRNELNQQEQDFLKNWGLLEKKIIAERTASKYLDMVRKGVYAPSWMLNKEFARSNRAFDINYVRVLYSDIPNSEVQVSDAEITNYIKANAKAYERDASVAIEYVLFDVVPTANDSTFYREKMETVATEWAKAAATEDTSFVESYDGKLDFKYYTKEDWMDPEFVKDSLFSMATGAVYGPYLDGTGNYKVVKLMGSKTLPDSVECRHIFKRANARDFNNLQQNAMLLDSLKKLIQKGDASFDSLAIQHNEDATRDKAGYLGWRKKGDPYGENFENVIFHIGEKDSLFFFQTREGLHLLQILNYKTNSNTTGYRVATIIEPIYPKTETEGLVQAAANKFMAENRTLEAFQNAAKENPKLRRATKTGLGTNDFEISAQIKGGVASEIIRWAHNEGKPNEVAGTIYPLNDPNDNYIAYFIVPALVSKSSKGLATIADASVKSEVEQLLRNKKKAELVAKKLEGANSLEVVTQKFNGTKIESASMQYSAPYIPEIQAVEPKIAGMAERLEQGKVSEPIEGNQGVYVIQVVNRKEGPALSTEPVLLANQRRGIISRMISPDPSAFKDQLMEALEERMTVKDNRSKIY